MKLTKGRYAYCIIDRDSSPDPNYLTGHFDRTVEDFQTQYKDKLIFRYSGPWPPYNFVAVNW